MFLRFFPLFFYSVFLYFSLILLLLLLLMIIILWLVLLKKKKNLKCSYTIFLIKKCVTFLFYLGAVWIHSTFTFCAFSFPFFFFLLSRMFWLFFREQCIRALFTVPQISLFSNFFIKNESHDTIHSFKNYFATVFSVFSCSKISSIKTDP